MVQKVLDELTNRYTRRTDIHNILIHHHIGTAAIAFILMFFVELNYFILLPLFKPVVTGHSSIVAILFAITVFPGYKLSRADAYLRNKEVLWESCSLVVKPDVIDNFIPHVRLNPTTF
jgi:hypothetical protein